MDITDIDSIIKQLDYNIIILKKYNIERKIFNKEKSKLEYELKDYSIKLDHLIIKLIEYERKIQNCIYCKNNIKL